MNYFKTYSNAIRMNRNEIALRDIFKNMNL